VVLAVAVSSSPHTATVTAVVAIVFQVAK